MVMIPRADYAALYGPTVGDSVRLGDTSLVAVVEKDYAVYGDECLHGGGKTLRDGMGLAAGITNAEGALDFDRAKALGLRLDIPAGTAVRFEPGETRTVTLVTNAETPLVASLNPTQLAQHFDRVSGKLPEPLASKKELP